MFQPGVNSNMQANQIGTRAGTAAAFLLGSLAWTSSFAADAARSCDRACLEGFIDQYLQAVLAHDPKRVAFAKNAKFTENGQQLELGDGLWRTLSARGSYSFFASDPQAGRAAYLGSIREDGTPAMLAVHLKIEDRRIAEAETLVQRNEKSALGFEKIGYTWTDSVPAAQRMSRDELVRLADAYFTGLQQNDGKGDYPFTENCNRIENGAMTTNVPTPAGETRPDPKTAVSYSAQWSCKEQFESGLLHFVTRVRDRRYVAVDVERGVVFSFVFFDHAAGDTRTFQAHGRTVTVGPRQPWTWELAEAFQLRQGKIHQIMAIMERVPYGMNSGWSTREQGWSSKARDVTKE
jgi:hypothetical protein